MSVSKYRRSKNRCNHRLIELRGNRHDSWLCNLIVGHEGGHESRSGHRRWPNDGTDFDYTRDYREDLGPEPDLLPFLEFYVQYHLGKNPNPEEVTAVTAELLKMIDQHLTENLLSKGGT